MDTNNAEPSQHAQRALAHARLLSKTGRGSTTTAEKQASEYVQTQLTTLGLQEVSLQTFSGERSLWLFIAMVLGLALVGHAAYWLLRKPAGELFATLIAVLAFGVSGYLYWVRFTYRGFPLRNSLPQGPSQNVIARILPGEQPQRKVVLLAHLDSHRAVFWFASDFMVRLFGPFAMIAIFGIFLAIPVYILAAITGWLFFGWLGITLACFHFLGWFTGVTADLGPYSPGANDNASSVGTLLGLAGRLVEQPLRKTEVWLAFTGCEETSADGVQALMDTYGEQLKDAWFIDLEMVGIGENLNYIREEGGLRRVTIPQEIETMLKEVGSPYGLQANKTPLVGASTECSLLLHRGFKAACLIASQKGSTLMPEWHRMTDTPSKLQPAALERVLGLTWDLLLRLDR